MFHHICKVFSSCKSSWSHLRGFLYFSLFTLSLSTLSSCHEDDITVPEEEAWVASVVGVADEGVSLAWRASYESLTVSIRGCGPETRAVIVSLGGETAEHGGSVAGDFPADSWITLASDTLAADSIVAFTTTTNDSGLRREATLIFTDADDASRQAMLTVTQLSSSDGNANGADARADLYVGYGYDIYKALESPMAVRTKELIIDLDYLRQQNIAAHYEVIQDCRLSRTETRYVTTNSIHAFGKNLSEQQTNDADNHFEGCCENCKTAEELIAKAKGTLEHSNFGHGSLEKAVAARVIDRAALIDLQRGRGVPFTETFSTRLYHIRHASGSQRNKLIEQLLVDYGTHVIIQADLGGRLDYTFAMEKTTAFNSVQEMYEEIDYTLGRIADNDRTSDRKPITSKSQSGAITIAGGSAATRRHVEADIRGLDGNAQINPGHITDWLASIEYSPNPETDANLEVIHFELIPLWDLVWNDLRDDVRNATFRMTNRSDCSLPASFTGTDIYEIQPDGRDKDLFAFPNNPNNTESSLCRLLYFDGEPVLEVCSEYVPKIRTDERVVVAYPIYKQHIRMNQGLFLGDGIHTPAYVGFSNADCYVNPIPELYPGDRINTFYYVNGNLLLDNPTTVSGLTGKGRMVQDDYFYFVYGAQTYKHPIVKIGSQFWTRHDLNHKMGFTPTPNSGRPKTDEFLEGDVLYACYQYDIHRTVMADNEWTWGYVPNTYYDGKPNTRWFLPSVLDVQHLYSYLGFNPKALFPGQVSGFEARFNGYKGINDLINNRTFADAKKAVRYKGEYNFIATRNKESSTDAILLVLDKNYHFTPYKALGDWHEDYYPVRPVRGFMFEYPTLTIINENTY